MHRHCRNRRPTAVLGRLARPSTGYSYADHADLAYGAGAVVDEKAKHLSFVLEGAMTRAAGMPGG